jgi:hypothetical protein
MGAFIASLPAFDQDQSFNEVCLANNNMDDDSFSQVVEALQHLKLTSLTYCENEFGPKSVLQLTKLVLQNPNVLKHLALVRCQMRV